MKEEHLKMVDTFNKRLEMLYDQICIWLDELQIEYTRQEKELSLSEQKNITYTTKQLDVFTKGGENLFSIVPYGVWIIGAEGRVELEGDSGSESLVYLLEKEPSLRLNEIESEKDKIIREKLNGPRQEGWHWVDDRIIGKRPLLTKDIFMALLEKIN
jgi:hypothetical protein